MWYLTSDTDNRVLYVVPNKEITIGRSVDAQVCNFAIPDDASISRKHASLSVSDHNLYLQDQGSRYGTFINNLTEKVSNDVKIKLNHNDIVRFGKINSVWKVHEINFITCTSTLKGENLQNLKLCLSNLGGILKSEWDESCAYLTMPALTLTIKVVLALSQGAHIVTTNFWNKCVEAVRNETNLPDPKYFIPHVLESTLNKENCSFLPNPERKTIFAGKNVIFFSRRQFEMYKGVLTNCSATPLLLSETKITKDSLCDPNFIVIQYNLSNISQETQAQRNQINDIINHLKSKGKRVVADAEIGLAILFCSGEKYCNPNFDFPSEVIKQIPGQGQTAKPTNVLAQESQEPTQKLGDENVVINETLTPANSKRKIDEDEDFDTKANKKFASEQPSSVTTHNESIKRKHSDDINGSLNPNKKVAIDKDEDNIFNFLNNTTESTNQNNTEKLLNFTKPVQKTQTASNDEEDLFNFVQDKPKDTATTDKAMFKDNKINYIKKEMDAESLKGQKRKLEDDIDISAMRGSKLKSLMDNQMSWSSEYTNNIKVKKEDPEDIDQKMNNLDLGATVVTIRKDLIVKKEPIAIEESVDQGKVQKNFKVFKKVWPVKMQMTVIPKSSMSIIIPDSLAEEISSQSY